MQYHSAHDSLLPITHPVLKINIEIIIYIYFYGVPKTIRGSRLQAYYNNLLLYKVSNDPASAYTPYCFGGTILSCPPI